jgi:uncharacterized protein (TIGR03083 family)
MPIDDELQGLDPLRLMAAEAGRIEAYVSALPAEGWIRPSRCAGWTVRDLVAHLAASEDYHRACLDGRVGEFLGEVAARGATSVDDFNAIGIADLEGVPDAQLLQRFVDDDARTRRGFADRGDAQVDTSVGAYPARWQAFHLAGELATHADDLFVPVPTDDAGARTDWRARFSRFSLREAKSDLEIEVVDGATRVRGEGLDLELTDRDLVETVAARADDRVPAAVRAALSTMP